VYFHSDIQLVTLRRLLGLESAVICPLQKIIGLVSASGSDSEKAEIESDVIDIHRFIRRNR